MKKIIALLLLFAMIFSLAACAAGTPQQSASDPASEETASTGPVSGSTTELDASNPIKIGYLAWASGADAYFGLVAIAALEDRIEEINANGGLLGRKVELVWYDISADFS